METGLRYKVEREVAGLKVSAQEAGRLVQGTQWRYWACRAIWMREKEEWTQANFVGFVAGN